MLLHPFNRTLVLGTLLVVVGCSGRSTADIPPAPESADAGQAAALGVMAPGGEAGPANTTALDAGPQNPDRDMPDTSVVPDNALMADSAAPSAPPDGALPIRDDAGTATDATDASKLPEAAPPVASGTVGDGGGSVVDATIVDSASNGADGAYEDADNDATVSCFVTTLNLGGVCLLTTDCSAQGGVSTAGYCPGPDDVQCCTGGGN
jgi:hypothetical protein